MRKNVDIDNDTKLQELLDSKLTEGEKKGAILKNLDATHYANVFDALKQEPSITIPENFSTQVVSLAHKKHVKKELLTTYATYALVLLCFIVSCFAILIFVDKESLKVILNAIDLYKYPLVLGGVTIFIIQLLDYKLLGFPGNKVSSLD